MVVVDGQRTSHRQPSLICIDKFIPLILTDSVLWAIWECYQHQFHPQFISLSFKHFEANSILERASFFFFFFWVTTNRGIICLHKMTIARSWIFTNQCWLGWAGFWTLVHTQVRVRLHIRLQVRFYGPSWTPRNGITRHPLQDPMFGQAGIQKSGHDPENVGVIYIRP